MSKTFRLRSFSHYNVGADQQETLLILRVSDGREISVQLPVDASAAVLSSALLGLSQRVLEMDK